MNKQLVISIARRFVKGFLAGGIASMLVFLSAGTPISEFKDIGNLAFPLFMAFTTGGLQAVEKLLSWKS